MIKAGIYGATGYTGVELARILDRHPAVEIAFATSERSAGQTLGDIEPLMGEWLSLGKMPLVTSASAPVDEIDVAFLCLPHAAAAKTAVFLLQHNVRVIDLSADFRLEDVDVYEKWYKTTHPAPALLGEAIYGLTEFARVKLPDARLVANPGCYTTTSLLALQPIMAAQVETTGNIIIDAKSGVSGAGRAAKPNTHFVQVVNNFSPYAIGRVHRHLPEIEQVVGWWHDNPSPIIFSPHLLPVPRGILANVYVPLKKGTMGETAVRTLYETTYADEQFVHVLPAGQLATLAHAVGTNNCVISLTMASDEMLIITSATDNLVKGASGQAVQNMNVMFGLEEARGLR